MNCQEILEKLEEKESNRLIRTIHLEIWIGKESTITQIQILSLDPTQQIHNLIYHKNQVHWPKGILLKSQKTQIYKETPKLKDKFGIKPKKSVIGNVGIVEIQRNKHLINNKLIK